MDGMYDMYNHIQLRFVVFLGAPVGLPQYTVAPTAAGQSLAPIEYSRMLGTMNANVAATKLANSQGLASTGAMFSVAATRV